MNGNIDPHAKIRTNINLPAGLKKAWQADARSRDMSLSAFIVQAVQAWRATNKSGKKQ
jgi:hypothetical protein